MDIFKSFIFGETGLYATHVRFLNDSTEIKYGLGLLKKQYDNCLALLNKKKVRKDIAKLIKPKLHQMEQVRDQIKVLDSIDAYVTCFSKDCDSLYQWRSYTPEGGVSIGFSRQELQKTIFGTNPKKIGMINDNSAFWMFPYSSTPSATDNIVGCIGECLYNEDQRKDTLVKLLFSTKKADVNIANTFFLAALMKHKSFEAENEVRIVYCGVPCFEKIEIVGNKPRIPIVGACPNKMRQLIKGVVVSPHGNKEQNFYLAHLLAHKYNLDWEPIPSSSPYIRG